MAAGRGQSTAVTTPRGSCSYALGVGLGFATFAAMCKSFAQNCFYALDVGLGFATYRHRNGLAAIHRRFYALDVGLGFATAVLRLPAPPGNTVSMPSMSGWALQLGVKQS